MSPLLVIAIAAVGIGLTIRSARRGFGDRHALDAHHRALDTLAEIAARRDRQASQSPESGHVPALRPPRSQDRRHAKQAPRPRRPPDRAPVARTGPTWQAPTEDPARPPLAPPVPAASLVAQTLATSGVVRRYPPAHRKRAFPFGVVAIGGAAIAVVALVVGLAVVFGQHRSRSSAPRPAAAAKSPAPTTGTSISPSPVTLTSSDSTEARFRVAQTGANIELVPTSSCWVQIRAGGATGTVVFTGTLRRGDRRPLPAAQAVWLRMGNPPGMSIEVNGSPLPIAAPASSQPFNVVFEPTS